VYKYIQLEGECFSVISGEEEFKGLVAWLDMARLTLVVMVLLLIGRQRGSVDRLMANGIQAMSVPGRSIQIE
jgi:hypothetical protein